ncbi:MAG: DUF5131 family protein [Holophagaceae bacterium]|nr:DUF5131 family protein [Holophagaceae bacterium]
MFMSPITAPITLNFWRGWSGRWPTCANMPERGGLRPNWPHIHHLSTQREAFHYETMALRQGDRYKVYTNSMSDFWGDGPEHDEARRVALDTMRQTSHLVWMVLTRQPERILDSLETSLKLAMEEYAREPNESGRKFIQWLQAWLDGEAPENIWLGTTMEGQDGAAHRVTELLTVPATKRFLSCDLCCPQLLYGPEHGCCALREGVSQRLRPTASN